MIYRKARRAILLDIDTPRSFNAMCAAWAKWLPRDDGSGPAGAAAIECRHGDVYTTLPQTLRELEGTRVAVCGIHACDFLTDLCIDSAMSAGQNFAVMPCCHVDRHKGQLKQAASSCQISVGQVVDIMRMGRVWERGYVCHWRTVDRTITAENRILVGTAPAPGKEARSASTEVSAKERERLMERYREYHRDSRVDRDSLSDSLEPESDEDDASRKATAASAGMEDETEEEDDPMSAVPPPCSCLKCGVSSLVLQPGGSSLDSGSGITAPTTTTDPRPLEETSIDDDHSRDENIDRMSPAELRSPLGTLGKPEPEPEPRGKQSSLMEISVERPPAPPPAISRPKPTVPPQESLAALEKVLAASIKLGEIGGGAAKEDAVRNGIDELADAISTFASHGASGARLPRAATVLGQAQSRLRVLRQEALAFSAATAMRDAASAQAEAEALADAEAAAALVATPLPAREGSRSPPLSERPGPGSITDAAGRREMADKKADLEMSRSSSRSSKAGDAIGSQLLEEDSEEDKMGASSGGGPGGLDVDGLDGMFTPKPGGSPRSDGVPGTKLVPNTPPSVVKHHPNWRTKQNWSVGGSPAEAKARARIGLDGSGPTVDDAL